MHWQYIVNRVCVCFFPETALNNSNEPEIKDYLMKNINFIYLFFCSGMTVSIALQNLTVKTTVCLLLTLCNESKRAAKPVDFARHNFQPLPELTIHIFNRRKHCVQAKRISTQPDTSFGFTAIETDGKCSTGLKAVIMVTRL